MAFEALNYLYTTLIRMKKTGLFTFILIVAVSCLNEPDCYQLNNDTVVIYFKIIGGGNDVYSAN